LKSKFRPDLYDLGSLRELIYTLHPMNLFGICKNMVQVAVSHIVRLSPFSSKMDYVDNHDAMVNRLNRMKVNFSEKERRLRLDPFQRTFLEKSREYFAYGFGNRENSLKVKLQMFAGSVWCREHADRVIDQAIKVRHNVITNFDFDSPEALDDKWEPMIFSSTPALASDITAAQWSFVADNQVDAAAAMVSAEHLITNDTIQATDLVVAQVADGSKTGIDFAPEINCSPCTGEIAVVPVNSVQEICSVSDLFLSAQKYFLDANLFGAERAELSSHPRNGDESFEDLNMSFTQEDMALFRAAMDGAPFRFA
jgi:hypothetical protein